MAFIVSEGVSVSLLQTKTLFMRVKHGFVLMFSKVRHFLFVRPVSREIKWRKGAPKIRQATLCQQTQRKKSKSVFWLDLETKFLFSTVKGDVHTKREKCLKIIIIISRLPVHSTVQAHLNFEPNGIRIRIRMSTSASKTYHMRVKF